MKMTSFTVHGEPQGKARRQGGKTERSDAYLYTAENKRL